MKAYETMVLILITMEDFLNTIKEDSIMKKVFLIVICCLLVCLSACEQNQSIKTTSTTLPTENHIPYSVNKVGNKFQCVVYNEKNEVIKEFEPTYKEPDVCIINTYLVKYSVQAGTGKSTQATIYCNTKDGLCSQVFYSVFDETETTVAYLGAANKIYIKNIFEESKEIIIDSFNAELSPVADPFVSAEFSADGKKLSVKYLSGTDYVEKEQTFSLD